MNYKDCAYRVLQERKKALHSQKITQIALKKGWLKPTGKTPDLTMNAILNRDINFNKHQSQYIKTAPSTFALNTKIKLKTRKTNKTTSSKKLPERKVRDAIIQWLSTKGYGTNLKYKDGHEKGVDIRVKNNQYGVYYLIEVKGQAGSNDHNNFIHALGQIVTRITVQRGTKYRYGLGLPYTSKKFIFSNLPWQIAKRLNLQILLVKPNKNVTEYGYKNLKEQQK